MRSLVSLPGVGGRVGVIAVDPDQCALYINAEAAGVSIAVGLEEDDVRQLVAVLERRLRERSAGRRLDPAGECVCGHPRAVHQDQEAACRGDSACPCLVMRPAALFGTVQSCTVPAVAHDADQCVPWIPPERLVRSDPAAPLV